MEKTRSKRGKSKNLTDTVKQYVKARKIGKLGYERADRLINEIAAQVEPGKEVDLDSGKTKIVLVDRFSQGNVVWTPCAARRWDLKIIEP